MALHLLLWNFGHGFLHLNSRCPPRPSHLSAGHFSASRLKYYLRGHKDCWKNPLTLNSFVQIYIISHLLETHWRLEKTFGPFWAQKWGGNLGRDSGTPRHKRSRSTVFVLFVGRLCRFVQHPCAPDWTFLEEGILRSEDSPPPVCGSILALVLRCWRRQAGKEYRVNIGWNCKVARRLHG